MNIVVLKSIDLLVFFVPPIFFCHLMPERERERERERGGVFFCKNDLVVVCEQHNKSLFFKGDRKPQTLCPQF